MKEFKNVEDYIRTSDIYRKLQTLNINSPKVIARDSDKHIIIQEYIAGRDASEMIIQGEMGGVYLNQVREVAKAVESNGICLDYFPSNFIVTNKGIFYIGNVIYEKNDSNTFDTTGVKYWMNASELIKQKVRKKL